MNKDSNLIVKNSASLYLMNITKLALPLVTLPYLLRVLSKDCYGTVTYVKAVMQYMQILVDFGFMLSAAKDIVNARVDKKKINSIVGDVILAKLILMIVAFLVLIVMCIFIPILKANILYTALSFLVVALTCFMMDFLFKGLEEMQVITIRFILMRVIAVAFTFVFVKRDEDMIWIPVLDILGSIVAIILIFFEMKKRNLSIKISGFRNAIVKLKEAAIYFWSNMATTAFTALNTLLTGLILSSEQVADWGVCLQVVTAIQSMYTPVTDSIYPQMIKTRSLKLLKKTAIVFMPIVIVGCFSMLFLSRYFLIVLGGEKYVNAVPVLICLIPVLLFSFPSLLFGWPALGAINRAKEVTCTTIVSACVQVAGLIVLIIIGQFTPINIALLRGFVELLLFLSRYGYFRKYRYEFR